MNKKLIVFICLILSANAFSQVVLKGKVNDENSMALPGASVWVDETNQGTSTNSRGEYSLTLKEAGEYTVEVSFLGYATYQTKISIADNTERDFQLERETIFSEEVIVRSTRAGVKAPVTYSEVNKEGLNNRNLGQDLPYLLSMEPSLVTTSDAGAGVGYTGMWIRGSNIQRINVTVNGIPMNDSESHGVFFVNMPDFSSSVNTVQIQRGVGTSTNGGGAFGATMNMETNTLSKKAFAEINSAAGSFNTFKNNLQFGTGLIKDHWSFEGRLSQISSDGYIDRASSKMSSYFLQGGYYDENTTVKAVMFSGKEKTYQAWYGVDQYTMDTYGRTFNPAGAVFGKTATGETDWWNYGNVDFFYDNETDNYQQDHYQLHLSQNFNDKWNFAGALHYTYGRGYYEQYYQEDYLGDYPMGVQYFGMDSVMNGTGGYDMFYHDTVSYGDLIVRRWLDNHFYGATYAVNYTGDALSLSIGGAANKYDNARHYGEVVWSQFSGNSKIRDTFYDNASNKTDVNMYAKADLELADTWNLFADMQYRFIDYTMSGTDKGGALLDFDEQYHFFNPKVGVTYNLPSVGLIYGSYARANREPIRSDFTDAPSGQKPEHEELNDFELGLRKTHRSYFYNANAYFMQYANQLALTGEINDVGSPIRANVGESYRLGLELDGGMVLSKVFSFRANLALSTTNTDFKEEDASGIVEYNDVQISFSPNVVAGLELKVNPIKNGEIGLITKYVSKQYLDLTQNEDRTLDAYTSTDLRFSYVLNPSNMQELGFSLMVNNVFNSLYNTNGYVYWGTPYYYPQAGTNILAGVNLKF